MSYLVERFKEPSSWRAIFVLLGIFGINVAPEYTEAIVTVAGGVYSAINFFRKEKK